MLLFVKLCQKVKHFSKVKPCFILLELGIEIAYNVHNEYKPRRNL